MPNLDCTSKEISIQSTIVPVRKSLVQWLTESTGISKFGMDSESHVCGESPGILIFFRTSLRNTLETPVTKNFATV